jgi:hypothetical protein
MSRKSIEIAPKPIRLNGNIASSAALGSFEHRVFDEMADAIEFRGLVARATSHPDAGGYGAQAGHVLSQNTDAVGESSRVNFVNHEFFNQKLAEINTAPHPSTPETGGKMEPKWTLNRAQLLDSALIIGGKCELSKGSGKSPGLNQFAFRG